PRTSTYIAASRLAVTSPLAMTVASAHASRSTTNAACASQPSKAAMRTRFSSLRTLIGAVLVAGGFVVACSSQSRHSDTTVAQAGPPLGQSHVSRLPSNNSAAPPDAAEAPERPGDHALPLSRG